MKTLLPFFIAVFIIGSAIVADCQTPVNGPTASGHWTIDGSPYQIMDNIEVPEDSSLIIDPGVEVIFQGHYGLFVYGQLLANGTATDSIRFTTLVPVQGWNSMYFESSDESELEYCIFEYSHCSLSYGGGGAICNASTPMIIRHCYFRDNSMTTLSSSPYGGAVVFYYTQGEISDCVFENNSTHVSGGALLCWGASPMIMNCTFRNNYAGYAGGAIALISGSNPVIANCLIEKNHAMESCGGIGFMESCNPEITNCEIKYNITEGNSGGIGYSDYCDPVIKDCTIRGNSAMTTCGGIGIGNAAGTIEHCIIDSNMSVEAGGGIGFGPLTTAEINYCQINANYTGGRGGGIGVNLCDPVISNNTIVNNQAGTGGGIGFDTHLVPLVENCIIWDNTATDGDQVSLGTVSCDPDFEYNDIQGGVSAFGGPGGPDYNGNYLENLDLNPKFSDPATADYRLSWLSYPVMDTTISPCIDHGRPGPFYCDPDGTCKDMGAYYFSQMPCEPTAYVPPYQGSTLFLADWSSCYAALGFILDVAYDSVFENYVPGYDSLVLNDTTSQYEVTGLEPGEYYYRVKTFNTNCCSGYSNVVSVLLTGLPELTENPFRIICPGDGLLIKMDPGTSVTADLQVYNISGQLLYQGKIMDEQHWVSLNSSMQVLLVNVIINGKSYTEKIFHR